MLPIRSALRNEASSSLNELLSEADAESLAVVEMIAASGKLLAHSPATKDRIPRCVCFSACSLPGLINFSERYGRFGLAFRKELIFQAGGRPCVYVDKEVYECIARQGRDAPRGTPEKSLFGLANLYRPPAAGGRIQDYTHEREWRLFGDLELDIYSPEFIICPSAFTLKLQGLFGSQRTYLPIDTIFLWGA